MAEFLPKGEGAEILQDLANRAKALLETHEVNKQRLAAGDKPANSIWLWGHGRAPQMETLRQKFGISGAVISAVDLIKGIGVYAGLDVIEVPGATGYLDTDYLAKGRYALESLQTRDYVYVHVEAPDEASHSGNLQEKIRAIESFDQLVVGTVLEGLPALGEFRLMVLPDHPTPVKKMTHTGDAVPFILYDSRESDRPGNFAGSAYCEKAAVDTGFLIQHGYELMNYLITGRC